MSTVASPGAPIPPLSLEQLAGVAAAWNRGKMLSHQGVRLSFPSTDRVLVEIPEVRPEHRGGLGTAAINGGVLAMLFDLAIGITSVLAAPGRRNATVQLSMSFERALRGSAVRGEAWVDRKARDLVFSSARLLDERGQECARCQGVIALGEQVTLEEWSHALSLPEGPAASF